MIIGHYYIHLFALELFILEADECDVTQFNQINLDISSSTGLLIEQLADLFTKVKTIVKIWIIV